MVRKILIIKVGTSILLGEDERPSSIFNKLAEEVAALHGKYDIALVSSGAIGFGIRTLRLRNRPSEPSELQALSCIGQPKLMAHWQSAFKKVAIGQALATTHELDDKGEEKKLIQATRALWTYGAVPIFNENDALADEQIKVGDNDTLAAHIAVKLKASCLILLSDVAGVYKAFDSNNQTLLRKVLVHEAKTYVKRGSSRHGTGGLGTKINAAEIAGSAGIVTYLAGAHEADAINRILKGEVGTQFVVE